MTTLGTNRAAVLVDYGADLEIRHLPLPEPERGAVLVKVLATSLCGTDVHAWQGAFDGVLDLQRPAVVGHEIVGEVVAFGAGSTVDSVGRQLIVGDRIVWAPEACGHCSYCTVLSKPTLCRNRRIGMLRNCEVFPYVSGGLAEYSYVWPRSGRLRVPDAVPTEQAAASSCALRTVVNAIAAAGPLSADDRVLVQGAGPLGLFATAMAHAHGAGRVVVVGAPADRLALASAYGADETVSITEHPDTEDRRRVAATALGGDGASVVIEVAGAPGVLSEALSLVAPGGRIVLVGSVGAGAERISPSVITTRAITVTGVISGDIDSYHRALTFMERWSDRFDWSRMITNRFRLEGATAALRAMASGGEIEPIIAPHAGLADPHPPRAQQRS